MFTSGGLESGVGTARDLVHSELRHHPDHIVVGDVRRGDYGPSR